MQNSTDNIIASRIRSIACLQGQSTGIVGADRAAGKPVTLPVSSPLTMRGGYMVKVRRDCTPCHRRFLRVAACVAHRRLRNN